MCWRGASSSASSRTPWAFTSSSSSQRPACLLGCRGSRTRALMRFGHLPLRWPCPSRHAVGRSGTRRRFTAATVAEARLAGQGRDPRASKLVCKDMARHFKVYAMSGVHMGAYGGETQ
eukprot:11479850-Alexandrium_andersonii.AAC.1